MKSPRRILRWTLPLGLLAATLASPAPGASAQETAVCGFSVPLVFGPAEADSTSLSFKTHRLGVIECEGRIGDSVVSGVGTLRLQGVYRNGGSAEGPGSGTFRARLPEAVAFIDRTYQYLSGSFSLSSAGALWGMSGTVSGRHRAGFGALAQFESERQSGTTTGPLRGILRGRIVIG